MFPRRRTSPRPKKRRAPKARPKAGWCSNSGARTQAHELGQLEVKTARRSTRSIYAAHTSEEAQDAIRTTQKTKLVRCKDCGRRLHPKAIYCVGGEFVCFSLPRHKARV